MKGFQTEAFFYEVIFVSFGMRFLGVILIFGTIHFSLAQQDSVLQFPVSVVSYPSGKVQAKGPLKDSLRHGEWLFYREDGSLVTRGRYENGIKSGPWITYHTNGKIFIQETYAADKLDGESLIYYDTGLLMMQLHYLNGRENGNTVCYFENGEIKFSRQMKNGALDGRVYLGYPNGEQRGLAHYQQDKQLSCEGDCMSLIDKITIDPTFDK